MGLFEAALCNPSLGLLRSFGTSVLATVVNAKDFGAVGNGTTNDTSALQSAINSAASSGHALYIPPGVYRITSPLKVEFAPASQQWGLKIVGHPGERSAETSVRSTILWDGSNGEPALKLWTRDCIVEDLIFRPADGKNPKCAIQWSQSPVPGSTAVTRNTFRRLLINHSNGGTGYFDYGITIGENVGAGFPMNCDYGVFERVVITYPAIAAVYIPNPTGQSKAHVFRDCAFAFSQYGILQTTGSFHCDACAFSVLSESAIAITQCTDALSIRDSDSEHCRRLIQSLGEQAAPWPLIIDGGRYDVSPGALGQPREYIDYHWSPLILRGCSFGCYNPAWYITSESASTHTRRIICEGVSFPNQQPFHHGSGQQKSRVFMRQCCVLNSAGTYEPISDRDDSSAGWTQSQHHVTTDATPVVAWGADIPCGYERPYIFDVDIQAHCSSDSLDAAHWSLHACGWGNGGAFGLVGSVDERSYGATAGAAGWDAVLSVSGTPGIGAVSKTIPTDPSLSIVNQYYRSNNNWIVQIVSGGSRGTATFRFSSENGAAGSWSDVFTTADSFMIPNWGIELQFAAGTYTTGGEYTWAITVPRVQITVTGEAARTIRWWITSSVKEGW